MIFWCNYADTRLPAIKSQNTSDDCLEVLSSGLLLLIHNGIEIEDIEAWLFGLREIARWHHHAEGLIICHDINMAPLQMDLIKCSSTKPI